VSGASGKRRRGFSEGLSGNPRHAHALVILMAAQRPEDVILMARSGRRTCFRDRHGWLTAAASAFAPIVSSKLILTSFPVLTRPKIAVGGLMP